MLGAAIGGILLGSLGDRIGRARAMGVSILFYSVFAGLGAWVQTQEQMLVLRFMVGLGVGGVWPNAVALVAECWPDKARPTVAGLMGVAINAGILMLSQIAQVWSLTADSWRWLFTLAAAPAALGLLVLFVLPESPAWLATRGRKTETDRRATPVRELFRPPLLKITLTGIMLGSIPLVGAWAASKWMIPWADQIGGVVAAGLQGDDARMVGVRRDPGQFRGRPDRQSARTPAVVLPDQPRIGGADDRDVSAHGAAAPLVLPDRVRAGLCRDAVLRLAAAVSAGALPHARARHGHRDFLQCRTVRDGRRSPGGGRGCSPPSAAAIPPSGPPRR